MTQTVYGIALDPVGLASKLTLEQGPTRPEIRRRAWATPSGQVRTMQDERIPIDRDHDHQWIGDVIHMENTPAGLWVVGHVSDDIDPSVRVRVADRTVSVAHPLYWSVESIGGPDYGYLLTSIAITTTPARVSPTPLTLLPGALDHRQAADRWRDRVSASDLQLLTRAACTSADRRRDQPIVVRQRTNGCDDANGYDDDGDAPPPLSAAELARLERDRPVGPWRYSAPVRGSVLRVG